MRTKSLILVVLVFFIIFLGLYFPMRAVVTDYFDREQKKQTANDMQRLVSVLSVDLRDLDGIASDWATWDDSYKFVQDHNEEYIEGNLSPLSFTINRLSGIAYIEASGNLVWAKAYDKASNTLNDIPDSLKPYVSPGGILLNHPDVKSKIAGYISLPEGIMLISSHPILTTDGKGPIRGTLIFGRYLDSTEINMLSETTALPITTSQFSDLRPDLQSALSTAPADSAIVAMRHGSRSLGYAMVNDIYGKPAIVFETDIPATLYNRGKQIEFYLLVGRTIAFIFFAVVVLILLNKAIISRLERLKSTIGQIASSGDLAARVSVKGKDEISNFASSINNMLGSLERAHTELSQAEQMFAALSNGSPTSIYIYQGHRFKYVNPQFQKDTGYNEQELLAINTGDLVFPEDLEMARSKAINMLKGESSVPYEYRVINKSGEVRWVLQSVASVKLKGERAILGTRVDITALKQIEEALRQSEEKYRFLVSNIPDAVWTVDEKGNTVFISDSAEGIIGYPVETLYKEGMRIWLDNMHPDDVQMAKDAINALFRERVPLNFECRIKRQDGQWIWVHQRAVNTYRKDGVQYVDGLTSDITQRKISEEMRIHSAAANARADELLQSRRRLVNAEEYLRRDIAQQLHGSVQNRLIVLILRLSELENAPNGEVPTFELADIHKKLEDLLEGQVRPISHRLYPSILRQGLIPALQSLTDHLESLMTVELKFDEGYIQREKANRQFVAEPVRLAVYRIVEEALNNVVKHAKASKVIINLGLTSDGRLRFMVKDNGQGFDLAKSSANAGMLMMRDYAEVSGGECIIKSASGEGTEITATFSFAEPRAEFPAKPSA